MNTVLLVAAPLIVFALVLLLGFTGCWLDSEGKGPGPPMDGDPGDGDGDGDGEGPPPVPYAEAVENSGPIAYWRLTDLAGSNFAADEIPSPPGAHPGAYQGTVAPGQGPPLNLSEGNAKSTHFDGTGYVEIPHDPAAFETAQFTVEALVAPDSVVGRAVVVGNMSSSLNVGGGWELAVVPPSPGDPDIDGFFAPVVSDGSGPASGPQPVAFDFAKLGTAWHLAITFDGMELILYWDGVKVDWGSFPYAPNTQNPIQIGLDFKGAIQEVAVYGVALTSVQIGTHYLANASPGP
jgi:hypothetical protein